LIPPGNTRLRSSPAGNMRIAKSVCFSAVARRLLRSPMMMWMVIGFTLDDVVSYGNDYRLAEACAQAWKAQGRPADFDVKLTQGESPYMLHWYISPTAARVLDAEGVIFRDKVIGSANAPPAGATNPIRLD
jgi:hypothetical protein